MEINLSNVKEIVLLTNYIFMAYQNNFYKDELHISSKGASYKRKGYDNKAVNCSWEYKGNSKIFKKQFNNIINRIKIDLFDENSSICYMTDCGEFTITIIFKDGTNQEFEFSSNFALNNLGELALAFLQVIPAGFAYPDLLCFCEHNDLDSKTVKRKDVVAHMYDLSDEKDELLTYQNGKYTLFLSDDVEDERRINSGVLDMFDDLFEDKFGEGNIEIINSEHGNWIYLSLGGKRHLYIKEEFYRKIWHLIYNVDEEQRNNAWEKLIGVK